ncbi:cerato-platanin-like secreted protein [Trametes coccinea BRFM310]|uniref:Cerato-platanin-like secreted protein n=1 Tax=Trametes coccinea (strain BRFM310) TaxID=1353009 RepID=A0A1Y2IYX2_TRAC3|nr:cerato-platanin-like secreted protein [Trametes coccinea BRFM310]
MQLFAILASALSLASVALAVPASTSTSTTMQITYDPVYDKKSNSLNIVACSNGKHGLETKGYTTFGSLPATYVGGVQAVAGWNSANCGTCWQVSYNGTTLNVLAIDHADSGVNLGEVAMNKLTHGHAVERGVIHAKVKEVDVSNCGFGKK